ncbi:MAG: hypothetical protein HRT88_10945 [Lentisphaeraceae bacterium]|nr:hypothetical protein [Lentisphaeraceae bacterium]
MKQQHVCENERLTITTREGSTYSAVAINSDSNEIYVRLNGFGNVSIPWSSIVKLDKQQLTTLPFSNRLRVHSLTEKTSEVF